MQAGHEVVGLDNFSKYGPLRAERSWQSAAIASCRATPRTSALLEELMADVDQVVAGAAMIGGISYFHEFAYDLLAENERITAATFDAAIAAFKQRHAARRSTSSARRWSSRTPASGRRRRASSAAVRRRSSTYGFQKLATEYFAQGAWEQYDLPYTIIRPFNCVGIGERRALCESEVLSGNVKLAMSHVVPDLIQKVLKGQDPLHILGDGNQVRHYTYGGDLARGIRLCIEKPEAVNEDFNLSTDESTTVLRLAELIWKKLRPGVPFRYVSRPALSATTCRSACPTWRRRRASSASGRRRRSARCSTSSFRGSSSRSSLAISERSQPGPATWLKCGRQLIASL